VAVTNLPAHTFSLKEAAMQSRHTIAGQPLHSVLVGVPVGFFLWAFAADIAYLATYRQVWYDISFWSAIAGIVTALVAAVPGFGGYLAIARGRARTLATVHMIGNQTVVGLFVIATIFALDNAAMYGAALTWMVTLHAIGAGMLALTGFLGTELVYRHYAAATPRHAPLTRVAVSTRRAEQGR
jgi:uncharacterized membrane protein